MLAYKMNAIFKVVSAKTGKGINDLFEAIGKKLLNPKLDIYLLFDEED